ncbi:MAG: peptide-methionine (R)-S-oxide reductase MsrB [Flavobacterium sp.]|nr:peptide-methionine (R)-S-oxide reductase MsrB [Pedobacter sp.]
MKNLLLIAIVFLFTIQTSCGQKSNTQTKKPVFVENKTDAEWKKILNPAAFEVMVKRGTETPFKNPYNNNHQKGIYVSAATGEPLFSSEDKFESGTGWPSFTKPINSNAVTVVKDNSFGMERNEVVETKTGLHLGHVFDDGPADKGGKRFCMNSAAFKFIKK